MKWIQSTSPDLKPLSKSDEPFPNENNGYNNKFLVCPPLYNVSSKSPLLYNVSSKSPPPYTVSSISILLIHLHGYWTSSKETANVVRNKILLSFTNFFNTGRCPFLSRFDCVFLHLISFHSHWWLWCFALTWNSIESLAVNFGQKIKILEFEQPKLLNKNRDWIFEFKVEDEHGQYVSNFKSGLWFSDHGFNFVMKSERMKL